jgi:hypothetical protein
VGVVGRARHRRRPKPTERPPEWPPCRNGPARRGYPGGRLPKSSRRPSGGRRGR